MLPLPTRRTGSSTCTEVTYQSNSPSLSRSPTALPMPLASRPVPETAVKSENVPLPLFRK